MHPLLPPMTWDSKSQMATGIEFCVSSILRRPDSRKTSNCPSAKMLRKLVRDCKCPPVLRGILESLLNYLTQDLPKWTMRNRHPHKPVSDILAERTIDSDQTIEPLVKQTQLKTSCFIVQLSGEHKTTRQKPAETSSKTSGQCLINPQKERLPSKHRVQRTGELIPRRLTTFQLLQSKFLRSTPKPLISRQREVGTLSSKQGTGGVLNHCQSNELNVQTKNQTRREQGPNRGSSVKDIVAKFAMAEHKRKQENMLKQQPTKPRLIGKGIILSSLMKRFETMATVCKGSALKCSHDCSSGRVAVTTDVKQRVACHESWHQQAADQTVGTLNQHKQIKGKSVGLQTKGNETINGQERRPGQAEDILTNINP